MKLNNLHRMVIFLFVMQLLAPFAVRSTVVQDIDLVNAFPNLESFNRPVDYKIAHDDSNRIFVVEQQGIISVFTNDRTVTSNDKSIFLDISDKVSTVHNEEGLLGLAFHPNYKNNSKFYVYYSASNPRRSILAEYTASETNQNIADDTSENILLEISQPYGNHNGGGLLFGPDNYLYLSLGDGGGGGDPGGNGQDRTTLLGSILRLDVDNPSQTMSYGIPEDNPFVNNTQGFQEEIFAYGLRNTWRFSFDSDPGTNETKLWAADVGQNAYEEIDLIERGKNYGWNIMEGKHCYGATECNQTGLTLPIHEYDHGLGRSITGGYVYRGTNVPSLYGKYIYADFISGRIWALEYTDQNTISNEEIMNKNLAIASFGVDQNQELYILAFDGNIYGFQGSSASENDGTNGKSQNTSSFIFITGVSGIIAIILFSKRK